MAVQESLATKSKKRSAGPRDAAVRWYRGTTIPGIRALVTYYMNVADFGKGAEFGQQPRAGRAVGVTSRSALKGIMSYGASVSFGGDLGNRVFPYLTVPSSFMILDSRLSEVSSRTQHRRGGADRIGAHPVAGAVLLERSVGRLEQALDVAREIDHPYSIAFALYHNGFLPSTGADSMSP